VTTKSMMLLILALALVFLLSAAAHAQRPEAGTIWMTSNLTAKGDGMNAQVDCSTSAVDPLNQNNVSAFASIQGYYKGLGTVCNVYVVGDSTNPVWSSSSSYTTQNSDGETIQVQGPCSGGAYPALGSGHLALFANGAWKSDCNGSFPVTPGATYQLTSQHYLWLYPGGGNCDSGENWDPYAWYDYIVDDLPW